MKSKILASSIFTVAFLSPSSVLADSQGDKMIRDSQVSYVATHADGTKEKIVVKYEAFLGHKVWQTGEASKPLEGHPIDDRTCHYDTDARLYRRAYVLTHSGVPAPLEEYQAIYKASTGGKDGAVDIWQAVTGKHTTCGSVNNFGDKIAAAESGLIGQFDSLVAQDDDKARVRLKALLVATELNPK
jgi:hypothetical protein